MTCLVHAAACGYHKNLPYGQPRCPLTPRDRMAISKTVSIDKRRVSTLHRTVHTSQRSPNTRAQARPARRQGETCRRSTHLERDVVEFHAADGRMAKHGPAQSGSVSVGDGAGGGHGRRGRGRRRATGAWRRRRPRHGRRGIRHRELCRAHNSTTGAYESSTGPTKHHTVRSSEHGCTRINFSQKAAQGQKKCSRRHNFRALSVSAWEERAVADAATSRRSVS